MAEPDKRPVTLEELLVSSLAQTDALAKLLIERGLITREEFMQEDFGETGDVSEASIKPQHGGVILWLSSTVPNARKKFQTRRQPVPTVAIIYAQRCPLRVRQKVGSVGRDGFGCYLRWLCFCSL